KHSVNQPNFPDQPSWRDNADNGHDRRENADVPPLPPGPDSSGLGGTAHESRRDFASDPRRDPRWVYSSHDSLDESREIPYFSGAPGPREDCPQHSQWPHQGPQPKPARRGPLHGLIIAAGILGSAILVLGLLSQLLDW